MALEIPKNLKHLTLEHLEYIINNTKSWFPIDIALVVFPDARSSKGVDWIYMSHVSTVLQVMKQIKNDYNINGN